MSDKKERLYFSDFLHDVYNRCNGLSKHQVEEVVRAAFDSIKYHMYTQKDIHIPNFGTFTVFMRPSALIPLPGGQIVWTEKHLKPKIIFSTKFRKQLKDLSKKRGIKNEKEEMDYNHYLEQ